MKSIENESKLKKFLLKNAFPLFGFGALIWFLIRVIPKPVRAGYPCMQVVAPMASSFVLWIIGLTATLFSFKKMRLAFAKTSYLKGAMFLFAGVLFTLFTMTQSGITSFAEESRDVNFIQAELTPNEPMGTGVGIFPGRVVWVHNPDATNENCDPMEEGNSYFEPKNNDQDVIDNMVSKAIQNLTGEVSDNTAWDAIFKFHNNKRGKGEVGYQAGEKIFIKINATSGWSGNINDDDLSKVYSNWWGGVNNYYGLSETTPSFILSVLRNLVNVAGVEQSDIYIGDPMKHIYKHSYDFLHAEFPDVHYLDHNEHASLGRELAEKGVTPQIKYSDRGTVLVYQGSPVYEDKLYKIFEDMEYMLNLPSMKGHVRGGVTMFAKNHFGSHTRDGANHLHNGLMEPGESGLTTRSGYGLYRIQVDIMGHEILGKKNLFFLMDALWGTDHELNPPHKWQIAPFNNDWTSSVLASFDPVAIESVGYDFIRTEFTLERYPTSNENVVKVIQLEGVCDYLRQAADSSNWPDGIEYDPENDGIILSSLGVHEHWNNAVDKQYSRNLGTGDGIELIKIVSEPTAVANKNNDIPDSYTLNQNYPNPFNPTTAISFSLKEASEVKLTIYDALGNLVNELVNEQKAAGFYSVNWNGTNIAGGKVVSGNYMYRLSVINTNVSFVQTKKMILLK